MSSLFVAKEVTGGVVVVFNLDGVVVDNGVHQPVVSFASEPLGHLALVAALALEAVLVGFLLIVVTADLSKLGIVEALDEHLFVVWVFVDSVLEVLLDGEVVLVLVRMWSMVLDCLTSCLMLLELN